MIQMSDDDSGHHRASVTMRPRQKFSRRAPHIFRSRSRGAPRPARRGGAIFPLAITYPLKLDRG
jgi:hypothetical protein